MQPIDAPRPSSVSRRTVIRHATTAAAAATVTTTGLATDPAWGGTTTGGVGSRAAEPAGGEIPATLGGAPLLCEPYLLDPTPGGVHVVWHTERPGGVQVVLIGTGVEAMTGEQALEAATGPAAAAPGWRRVAAESTRLRRTREDADSQVPGRTYPAVTAREVWRHLATVTGLAPGRTPYRVVSVDGEGRATVTAGYSLAPAQPCRAPVRLLLTSDHQLKTMTAANIEKVSETVGVRLDGVLMAGDLVNAPDRASDWFDSTSGLAFFANVTGRASRTIAGRTWRGAPLLQHTPLYPAIGNHEVMGRWSETASLTSQFNDPQPRAVAERHWDETRPPGEDRESWLARHSWDTTTYEEMFPYPRSAEGGPRWYARSIGDVHLVSLFVTGIWRPAAVPGRGKFSEAPDSLANPDAWGYGQFLFEPVTRGSRQYAWLSRQLASAEARRAKYRVVMFHHPSHGLGDNSAPAYADPVQRVVLDPATGAVTEVSYSYPLADDVVLRDLQTLLTASGVNLVHNGHSHLWNRFRSPEGVNWLETSNVGNSYGAFDTTSGRVRALPAGPDHVLQGDPGGLRPVTPTVAPLADDAGAPLPYLSSNDITAFSVLDSGAGTVRSYRFDTRDPGSPVVLFDEFPLAR